MSARCTVIASTEMLGCRLEDQVDEMAKREKQRIKEANTAATETLGIDEDRCSDVDEDRCSDADEDRFSDADEDRFSEADEDLEMGEELETGEDSRYLIRLLDAVDEADEGLLAAETEAAAVATETEAAAAATGRMEAAAELPYNEKVKALNKQMMVLQSQLLDEATADDVRVQLERQSEEYVSTLHCDCID